MCEGETYVVKSAAESCTGSWLVASESYAQLVQYKVPLVRPAETMRLSTGSLRKCADTHLKHVYAWLWTFSGRSQVQHAVTGAGPNGRSALSSPLIIT